MRFIIINNIMFMILFTLYPVLLYKVRQHLVNMVGLTCFYELRL